MMSDFKIALTLLKNAPNLKKKILSTLLVIIFCVCLFFLWLRGRDNGIAHIEIILLIWCVEMIPVNDLQIYMSSSLVMSSPLRKRLMIRIMSKLTVCLNLVFFFFTVGFEMLLFQTGKIDVVEMKMGILTSAMTGGMMTVYIILYYKRMWLSIIFLMFYVILEIAYTAFGRGKFKNSDFCVKLADALPLYGIVLVGVALLFLSDLLIWGYSIWSYRRPLNERAFRQLVNMEKL